jgi:ribosome-associated toxin RatA of RatAB toxin-antitoxin module
LRVTQSESYQYSSDIEKYVERYPWYYKTIDVIERTDNGLTSKMFLNVHLSAKVDHALVTTKYKFIPETEIRYEVIRGPGQGIIKNSIIIRGGRHCCR